MKCKYKLLKIEKYKYTNIYLEYRWRWQRTCVASWVPTPLHLTLLSAQSLNININWKGSQNININLKESQNINIIASAFIWHYRAFLHKIIRSVWLSAEKNITRIGDRSIYANSQPAGKKKKKKKPGNGTVTTQIFSICNNHTQQLPYSVCVRCHAVTHCRF